MNCYRTSNNKFFTAPPRMADGRHFTDYRPNEFLNNMIIKDNNVEDSYNYRQFLIQNGDKIMELNWKHAYLKNGSFNCKKPYPQGTMLPEQDKVKCDLNRCNIVSNNKNGLGRGRVYTEEENELLDSLNEPEMGLEGNKCTPYDSNFNYYPLDQNNQPERQAVQGGGRILSGGDPREYQ